MRQSCRVSLNQWACFINAHQPVVMKKDCSDTQPAWENMTVRALSSSLVHALHASEPSPLGLTQYAEVLFLYSELHTMSFFSLMDEPGELFIFTVCDIRSNRLSSTAQPGNEAFSSMHLPPGTYTN